MRYFFALSFISDSLGSLSPIGAASFSTLSRCSRAFSQSVSQKASSISSAAARKSAIVRFFGFSAVNYPQSRPPQSDYRLERPQRLLFPQLFR